jgi:hypothetical protein
VLDIYNGLARITIENGEGYYVGTTSLEESAYGPGWIYNAKPKKQGTQYVGLSADGSGSDYDGVRYFDYPNGGEPTAYVDGIDKPIAVTISLGPVHV